MGKRIDITDQRVTRGRINIDSQTDDPVEYAVRRRAVESLIDYGSDGVRVLDRIRDRSDPLRIEELDNVVVRGAVDPRRVLELLEPIAEGEGPDGSTAAAPPMLGATVDEFLAHVEADLRESTYRAYRSKARDMEAHFGVERDENDEVTQDRPMDEITTTDARGWLKGKKANADAGRWSARTQRQALAVAKQVWDRALETDEERAETTGAPRTLERNVWGKGRRKVSRPRPGPTRHAFLSRDEAARLLRWAKGRPVAAYIAVGIYGGLRPQEKAHLRMDLDVDLDRLDLHVQPRGGEYPWAPKSDRGVRDVPMNQRLVRWIRAHIADGYAGSRYLFRTPGRDRPISLYTSGQWIREAFTAVGIRYGGKKGDELSDHSLRHTCGSWLAQDDVQLMKIADYLGITVEVASQHYIHLIPKDKRETAERLGGRRRLR